MKNLIIFLFIKALIKMENRMDMASINGIMALVTAKLECGRGGWNSACSSEMRRYAEEYRW